MQEIEHGFEACLPKDFYPQNYVPSTSVKKGGNVINLRRVCRFREVRGDKEAPYVPSKYTAVCTNHFYGAQIVLLQK